MPRPRFRRLSPEELVAKRANGECYYYTEKFSNDHKCKTKSVFLLEMDDGDEPEALAEDLGISLHALTSIDVADTMKLHIKIHGQTLVALMDTGSTHTFVKETVVPHISLLVTPRQGLTVKVTNGERVASHGVCKEADMVIGDEHFTANLYVLPLDGFDIVLDVH
jgi:hypothetical protein